MAKKIKVSKKAEKELAQLCDKMFEWAEKYRVRYISVHIRRDSQTEAVPAANATYLINDADSNNYQHVEGKYDKKEKKLWKKIK